MKHAILFLLSCLALNAEEPPKKVEPKNTDKLSVKLIGSGEKRQHQVTGRAGTLPLVVRWGRRPEDSFQVEPWQSKTLILSFAATYLVTASEAGKIVDKEGSTRKTGLGSDTKLR